MCGTASKICLRQLQQRFPYPNTAFCFLQFWFFGVTSLCDTFASRSCGVLFFILNIPASRMVAFISPALKICFDEICLFFVIGLLCAFLNNLHGLVLVSSYWSLFFAVSIFCLLFSPCFDGVKHCLASVQPSAFRHGKTNFTVTRLHLPLSTLPSCLLFSFFPTLIVIVSGFWCHLHCEYHGHAQHSTLVPMLVRVERAEARLQRVSPLLSAVNSKPL